MKNILPQLEKGKKENSTLGLDPVVENELPGPTTTNAKLQ
jgi:hypothetical protein